MPKPCKGFVNELKNGNKGDKVDSNVSDKADRNERPVTDGSIILCSDL